MNDLWFRFTSDLIERLDGPLHFRFLFQPLIAAAFAFRDGRRDAENGRLPYGWALIKGTTAQRRWLLENGWKGISNVFIIAFVLDLIYQVIALHTFKLDDAFIIACLLALIPYLLLRGPINFLTQRQKHNREHSS